MQSTPKAPYKLIQLTLQTSGKERKTIEKEVRIYAACTKRAPVHLGSVVEPDGTHIYAPGIYIVIELFAGVDLFDKIGMDA